MKAHNGILHAARWIALALLTQALALPALAQSPVSDSFNPGADGEVYSLALQVDGRILVGGAFATLAGQSRNCIGRLNADGTVDTSFNPGADWPGVESYVVALALQPDGKILVGGSFAILGGQSRNCIGRLNADGTVDTSFNPSAGSPGAVDWVYSMALQPDGKTLVGGYFAALGGLSRTNIGRLNADGTVDQGFNPGADGWVYSLALQADGKILVGGVFATLGGQSRTNIGRLNGDGTVDTSFNPGTDGEVYSLAVQADGKILVGGQFTTLGGQSRNYIGRLNADGTLDTSFNPGAGGGVWSLALQADGKILVGGGFSTLGGQSCTNIGRLNADGTVDLSFEPEAIGGDNWVASLGLQADGKILVGGGFSTLGGQSRTNIGRLNNTVAATQSLAFDRSAVTWARGGASPEVWRTTFESSLDGGVSWTSLGAGTRIAGGWQLTGLALPTNTTLRTRGYTAGGVLNSATWFVETYAGSPLVVTPPASLTNNAGTVAAFTVYAGGNEPLGCQWYKGGVGLADGGNVSGTATASLTLSNVLRADGGSYWLVITNADGSATSAAATLTVVDPAINAQPASQARNIGDSAAFSVGARGTPPLSYQWRRDGRPLAGATQSFLTLTTLQGPDAGSYDVVVSNVWGNVTSTAGTLTLGLSVPDSFNPGVGAGYGSVFSMVLQPDGRILVGGDFATLGGQICTNIGRLNPDGTVDMSFNPGADNGVACLALQADGKILVGGVFATLGGQSRDGVGRLNADGTVDMSFNPGADNGVACLALQADGKILVGGDFTTLGGQSRTNIGRLNGDGTVDMSFNPGADDEVCSLALQADGKILVGGRFGTLGGQSRFSIGRLNADGTVDMSFNTWANGIVLSLAVQADGKILVGGDFTTLGGQSRTNIGRVNADGTVDQGFNPGADGCVYSLALQADGRILVGGWFGTLGGQSRYSIGRLNNNAPATQSLTFDGSTLSWTRWGASPEVWRTTFEYSLDGGVSWADLGPGTRVADGWQLTGLALPTNTTFRARGYTVGGFENGSAWFVETILRPPLVISTVSLSTTGQFGFRAAGPFGQVVVLDASPDLRTWTPLQTNTVGAGPLLFTDPQPASLPARFYRLRSGP